MNALPRAYVVGHRLTYQNGVHVVVWVDCPYCGGTHPHGWHSPNDSGGERTARCEGFNGRQYEMRWPDIPGEVSAALIEWRPDILDRTHAPRSWDNGGTTPESESNEGGH
jgi:hypothetical protein